METNIEKYHSYIASHGHPAGGSSARKVGGLKPAITISHQTGAGVSEIAALLARQLQASKFNAEFSWAVLDQQIIEKALAEHGRPTALAEKIVENRRFFVDELIDDVFDLQPPSWVFIPQVVETIRHLAAGGFVILVGHGATLVTAPLPNVFHVRLTGSFDRRVERIQRQRKTTQDSAAKLVRQEDRGRKKFVKAFFHARLDDELLYDLTINTDRTAEADATAVILEAAQRFFAALRRADLD